MNRPNAQPNPPEPRHVTTAQVAQAMGVSVTTVKRWVDDGILPAHRTAGGHRKLLMTDVLRLVREGNLPQADLTKLLPKAGGLADTAAMRAQMIEAVNAADGDLIRTIILGAYQAGLAVETLADEVIAPAMWHVGHEWSEGRVAVMREHQITQACISALYELRALLRVNAEPNRPVAVGGGPEHDHYVLPSLCAKLTLLDSGWDAINLGPHTPVSAFTRALEELHPTLIWISVSHLQDVDRFVKEYREFYPLAEAKGVAVAIGGSGLPGALRAKLPYSAFGDGLTHLAMFAHTLHRRPEVPKRGRPPGRKNDPDVAEAGES